MTNVVFGVVPFKLFSKVTSPITSCQNQRFKLPQSGIRWLTGKIITERNQRSIYLQMRLSVLGNMQEIFSLNSPYKPIGAVAMINSPAPFNKKRLKFRLKWAWNCSRTQRPRSITDVSLKLSLFTRDWEMVNFWEVLKIVCISCSHRVWFYFFFLFESLKMSLKASLCNGYRPEMWKCHHFHIWLKCCYSLFTGYLL